MDRLRSRDDDNQELITEGQVQTQAGKKIAVEVDASGKPIKP